MTDIHIYRIIFIHGFDAGVSVGLRAVGNI